MPRQLIQPSVSCETPREGRFSWAGLLRLAGTVCLGASWLMPNHYLPWYFFHSDALAFVAVFAWLLSLLLDSGPAIAVPRIAVAVLAVAAIPWFQLAGGLLGFAGEAWVATMYLAGLAGSLYIGFTWAKRSDRNEVLLQTVAAATLVAGLASTGLCLFQWLRLEDWLGIFIANLGETGRPFANMAQPNLLATLMLMSVVALVWTYEDRRIGPVGFGCALAFQTLGLSFTQSRAGYLGAIAIAGWWWLKHAAADGSRLNRWWGAKWLLLLGSFAFILPRLSAAVDLAGNRTVPLFDNNGRWVMWKQIAQGILESPWVGYGWEHTPAAQMAGAVNHPGQLATGYAHNIALDAMAWLGVPLALALGAAAAMWFVSRARQARGRASVLVFAMALPVAVHSVFEFPFAYAVFLFPVGILFGVVEALHPRTGALRCPRSLALALWLGLAALGWQIAREYVHAEEDFRFLRFEAARLGHTPPSHLRPDFLVLSQMDALLEVGRIKPAPGMSARQIERVRQVAVKYAWAPPSLLYAAALEANGRQQESAQQMRMIRGVYGENYYSSATARMDELREQWRKPPGGAGP